MLTKIRNRFRRREADPVDQRIADKETALARIQVRADRVAPSLEGRRERNHWAESIGQLYRGGNLT